MIHLEKINLLRPSLLNLFRKLHRSPERFYVHCRNKFPHVNTELTEVNSTSTLRADKYDFVANILLQYTNTESIPWDELTKVFDEQLKVKSEQNKLPNVHSVILETCKDLKQDTIAVSYCKYLVNTNKNLSLFDLFLIMKFLHTLGEKVAEHKELLKVLLNEIKPYLSKNLLNENLWAEVLCQDYDCWKDLIDIYSSLKDAGDTVLSVLATEAFNFNEYEMGCKIWNARQFVLKESNYISYLNYCIRAVEKGKFSTSLIDNLVERCQRSFSNFPQIDILPLFRTLVFALNSYPNKTHLWGINETTVNNSNICLNCHKRLKSLKITQEEFTRLRNHFLNDVLINKNVHIKTNKNELSYFLKYIKNLKYDVVLDGLNIVHKNNLNHGFSKRDYFITPTINYFKKKNMKILFIGRDYLKKYSFFDYIKKNCEIFFAHNLSDDDAFVMYATICGGIKTHFFTSDHLRGYSILLKDEEMQVVFRKWIIIRRFSFLPNSNKIAEPKVHCFLPQRTNGNKNGAENEETCWHFPAGCESMKKKMTNQNLIWYCLWRKPLDRNSS